MLNRNTRDLETGWTSRGYLPHFSETGALQHVTYHLADSLPLLSIKRMELQLTLQPQERRSVNRHRRIQALLDAGHGACVLRDPACAAIVENSLFHGDDSRYRLLAWVVMPNHVHVLLEQLQDWPLSKIIQSWKRHTSRQIRARHKTEGPGSLVRKPGGCTRHLPSKTEERQEADADAQQGRSSLWQRDYWDRYIRDQDHFATVVDYIEMNPVMAGLVSLPQDWRFGSA